MRESIPWAVSWPRCSWSFRQVVEDIENRERQYALRQRAIALGYKQDQVVLIDTDLGQSAASTVDRAGFQQLVAEVGMGNAGIILGLEVARLARNCADWHRLLEIATVSVRWGENGVGGDPRSGLDSEGARRDRAVE